MKTKLIFERRKKIIILPEWVDGRIGLAKSLTLTVDAIISSKKNIVIDFGMGSLPWMIHNFFSNLSSLSLYFEVNPTLLEIINAAMVQVKICLGFQKCPEKYQILAEAQHFTQYWGVAKYQEEYQELLKMVIIIFRTAADDVVTDSIPDREKQLYNETYALMAKSYLAEYLQCELKNLTDEEAYAKYAALYFEAYKRRGGVFERYAECYAQGHSRASLEISTAGSSGVTPSSSNDGTVYDTALEEQEKASLLGDVRDRFFSSSESELRRRHVHPHAAPEGQILNLYR